ADNAGIGAVLLLPGAIAQHPDRLRRWLVVRGNDGASDEGADAEGREVVAADKFAAQGLGLAVALAAACAELPPSRLECGQLREFRRVVLHPQIKLVGEHPPVILRAAFDAAVVPIPNAIEFGR